MAENSNAETQTSNLFPLDAPQRVVAFELSSGAVVRHIFRRPTDDDARDFFRAVQLVNDRRAAREKVDEFKPRRDLYARLALDAEGYPPVKGHSGKLCEFTPAPVERDGKKTERRWHDLIPVAHRLRAVDQLDCLVDPRGPAELDPDCDVTLLQARIWSGGRMVEFSGLTHRFEPLTDEDRTRFELDCARSQVVGGSRRGMTLSVPRQNVMLRLYDRKIRAVEGYSVNGRPVADVDEIRAQMDPFHKIAAVDPLVSEWALGLKLPGQAEPDEAELLRQMAEAENQPDRG